MNAVPASDTDSLVLLVPPANRLVGLWTTDIHVSPAACTPGGPPPPLFGRNTIVFDAGGTLVENPQVSPPGVPGAKTLVLPEGFLPSAEIKSAPQREPVLNCRVYFTRAQDAPWIQGFSLPARGPKGRLPASVGPRSRQDRPVPGFVTSCFRVM